MRDISEAEARIILAERKTCEDSGPWIPQKMPTGMVRISCGLVDAEGFGTGLFVQLDFRRSPTTRIAKFVFTVFQSRPHGPERVYQLDIEQMKAKPKNMHSMAHEHIGSLRVTGTTDWFSWSFESILDHFCKQTNITFAPTPTHPELFELVG
jgi:hypothetical protein